MPKVIFDIPSFHEGIITEGDVRDASNNSLSDALGVIVHKQGNAQTIEGFKAESHPYNVNESAVAIKNSDRIDVYDSDFDTNGANNATSIAVYKQENSVNAFIKDTNTAKKITFDSFSSGFCSVLANKHIIVCDTNFGATSKKNTIFSQIKKKILLENTETPEFTKFIPANPVASKFLFVPQYKKYGDGSTNNTVPDYYSSSYRYAHVVNSFVNTSTFKFYVAVSSDDANFNELFNTSLQGSKFNDFSLYVIGKGIATISGTGFGSDGNGLYWTFNVSGVTLADGDIGIFVPETNDQFVFCVNGTENQFATYSTGQSKTYDIYCMYEYENGEISSLVKIGTFADRGTASYTFDVIAKKYSGSSINKHIRNIHFFSKETDSSDYVLILSFNLELGICTDISKRDYSMAVYTKHSVDFVSKNDFGVSSSSETGDLFVTPYTLESYFGNGVLLNTSANYKTAVFHSGRLFAGNVIHNNKLYADRVIISEYDRPDMFPENNYIDLIKPDGDSIVALAAVSGYLLVFKKYSLTIINISEGAPSQYRIEAEFRNLGVMSRNSVFTANNSVFFANQIGVYAFDGKLRELSSNIRTDWRQYYSTNSSEFPVIGYDIANDTVIAIQGTVLANNPKVYLFNNELKAVTRAHLFANTNGTNILNFAQRAGKLVLFLTKSSDESNAKMMNFSFADLDPFAKFSIQKSGIHCGAQGVFKKLKKVYAKVSNNLVSVSSDDDVPRLFISIDGATEEEVTNKSFVNTGVDSKPREIEYIPNSSYRFKEISLRLEGKVNTSQISLDYLSLVIKPKRPK